MKYLLISIFLLFLSYGCDEKPLNSPTTTTTAPTTTAPTTTAPTLDKTAKEDEGSWTIVRWDGEDWIDTADKLAVSWTWRFVSHSALDDGRVRIKGGYNFQLSNQSNYDVEFVLIKRVFEDRIHIPIYTDIGIKKQDVLSKGTATVSSTFEIKLDDIDTANEITKMVVWASVART